MNWEALQHYRILNCGVTIRMQVNKYINELSEFLKKAKEGKSREQQAHWNQDALAFKFGIENGINSLVRLKV